MRIISFKFIPYPVIKTIFDTLGDLVPLLQFFKKREKHPWRSVSFSRVADRSIHLY